MFKYSNHIKKTTYVFSITILKKLDRQKGEGGSV